MFPATATVEPVVFTSSPSVTHADGDIEGGDESLPYPDSYNSPYPETKALAERQVWVASLVGWAPMISASSRIW